MKLDDFLPHYHFHEVHRVQVEAPPKVVFHALKTLTISEMPKPVFWLLALRELPARWLRPPSGPPEVATGKKSFLGQMLSDDFLLLAEEPDREVVLGLAGVFWEISPRAASLPTPAAFLAFETPGYAKVAANLLVVPEAGGAKLSTETRILALDQISRRKFRKYWFIIALGSGLIRRLWLRAIKRKAEKYARTPSRA